MRSATTIAIRQQTRQSRSFRVVESDCVAVTVDRETTHYQFVIEPAADGSNQVGFFRSRGESIHVRVAGNGLAVCDCLAFRRHGRCWHQDLARALIVQMAPVADQVRDIVSQTATAFTMPVPDSSRSDRFTTADGQVVELRKAPVGWEYFVEFGGGWHKGLSSTKELAREDAVKFIAKRARSTR